MTKPLDKKIMFLNKQQIVDLQSEYSKLESVNPDQLQAFYNLFNQYAEDTIVQLANANIKWLSPLATSYAKDLGICPTLQ